MTKEITIGPIDLNDLGVRVGGLAVVQALRRSASCGYDACDEMATTEQVVEYLIGKHIAIKWYGGEFYSDAAAIWGIDRDAAKRRIYEHCYGG